MASPAPTAPRTGRSRLRLVAFAVLGVAAAALTLSGCVSVKDVVLQQEGSIGSIDVVVTGCGSKANTPGCGLGNTNLESNATGTGQVLLGLKVNSRFVPSATFETNFPDSQPFTGEPVLHGRADAARPARRRAQVGRLHLGRPHVHAGPVGHGASADRPPSPARWVSRGVLLRLQLRDRIARRRRPRLPGDASRDLRDGAHNGHLRLHDLRGRDGRGRGQRLQRLRVPHAGARHGASPDRRRSSRSWESSPDPRQPASTSRSPRRPPCRVPPPSRTSRPWHLRVTARPR